MKKSLANAYYAGKINPLRFERKSLAFYLLSTLLLVGLLISPAAATAVNWNIEPSSPYVGDILQITGTNINCDDVKVSIQHDMTVPVIKGKYQLTLNDLQIPAWEDNLYTVQASRVKNMDITDREEIFGHWFHLKMKANADKNGVATICRRDNPLLDCLFFKNNIDIKGDALGSCPVDLAVTVDETLKTNSDGSFDLNYDTTGLPAGFYDIMIGDCEKTLVLTPVVDFSVSSVRGQKIKVKFTDDTNGNPDNWKWSFGDGTFSTKQNPVHTYKQSGKYKVSLTAGNGGYTDTVTKTIKIK